MDQNIVWGDEPVKAPIVSICGWCPNARERTLALKAEGKVVSHGMCPPCKEKFERGEKGDVC